MGPHSYLLSSTFFSIGLAVLAMEVGDPTIAARGPAPRAWTREGPSPAAPLALHRAAPDAATMQRVHEQYGRLPLSFEKNEGQTDRRVAFLSRGPGYTLFLSAGGEAVLALAAPPAIAEDGPTPGRGTGAALRLTLVGADREARAEGRDALPGTVNYLRGTDRQQWRTGIATYAKVVYDNVYPGIDLVYYGNPRQLEYDFVVRPGADPRTIALEVDGADTLSLDAQGDLVLEVAGRQVRQRKPVVYQEAEGVRTAIDSAYALEGPHRVRFQLGAYDARRPLVIDPTLVYSTYLGGSGPDDYGYGIAVDASGSAYVTGNTRSSDFPTTAGAFDTSANGGLYDAFVAKLDPTGAALVYSTYLGGSSTDEGLGIAVDASGSAYVTGITQSSDFPTTAGAFDTSFNGASDAFVTKLDAAGGALAYSTYLGGIAQDEGWGIAVDASGSAYVTGTTFWSDFPTTAGAFDTSFNGASDAFVTKLDAAGAALTYSTFLGGSHNEYGRGVAVDASGSAYVTGQINYGDFPTTAGAFDTSANYLDAFVTKLDAAGTALVFSTYLGGSGYDYGASIAVDASGSAYVTGSTDSSDFPTTAGAFDTSANGGLYDAFVAKLDPTGAALVYSTYLGGSGYWGDEGQGIAVDASGSAYVTGTTASWDFPTTADAVDTSWNYSQDVFVTKLDVTGATLAYSTFLGGTGDDSGYGVAVDATGNAYVTGGTASSGNFPTTSGAYDTSHNGSLDVFVTKISDGGPPAPRVTLTANGTHGPLRLASGDPLVIAVSFDAGSAGIVDPAEVYIGVATPLGWFWFDPTSQTFVPSRTGTRVYAGPFASFEPVTLVNLPDASVLRPGRYWWFISVDRNPNGIQDDGSSFDLVVTDIS